MIDTNYNTAALTVLLRPECLMERYHPLIPYRDALLALDCRTKNDIARLPDPALTAAGLPEALIPLLRRFLTIYDPNPRKFREIPQLCTDKTCEAAFLELYCLPGVKALRADLYCRAGFDSLLAIASATEEVILARVAAVIAADGLDRAVPLPKEIRTHIAVARAFTWDSARLC